MNRYQSWDTTFSAGLSIGTALGMLPLLAIIFWPSWWIGPVVFLSLWFTLMPWAIIRRPGLRSATREEESSPCD